MITWEPDADWIVYAWWHEDHVIIQLGKILIYWEYLIK